MNLKIPNYYKRDLFQPGLIVWAIIASIVFLQLGNPVAQGIENGEIAVGEPVVAISYEYSGIFCSGVMIETRIAVTAHHCIPSAGSDQDLLKYSPILVSFPGVINGNENVEKARVLKIVSKKQTWTIGDCAAGFCEDLDDVAFLIIDRDFPVPNNLRIASTQDIISFRFKKAKVVTYGYGKTQWNKSNLSTPTKMFGNLEDPNPGGYGKFAFNVAVYGNQNVCAGDSGGPSYVLENDLIYYLGPTSGTRRPSCIKEPETSNGFYGGTAIAYKPDLLIEAQKTAAELKVEEEAILKVKQEAEQKAKVEAEKVAQANKQTIIQKKVTIICIKGKLVKRVTSVKPVCPSGYKKK